MGLDASRVRDNGARGRGGGDGRDQEGDRDGRLAALETYGGLNPALQRTRILNVACAGSRRSTAAITTGRTWRSTRVPSDLLPAVAPAKSPEDYTRSAAPEV